MSACLLLLIGFAPPALGQATIPRLLGSADVGQTLEGSPGATPADEEPFLVTPGWVAPASLGGLPSHVDLVAIAETSEGDRLFSIQPSALLAGSLPVRTGDVVRWNGASYSIEFDADAAGIPKGVRTDGVSQTAAGLLLSFDTYVELAPGLVAADEDLVEWNGSSFAIVFDGSAEGVSNDLDVDGLQSLGGAFLMSFDKSGVIAGIPFDDEDILRFEGGVWSLEMDVSAISGPDWVRSDLDAVDVPEPSVVVATSAGLGLLALLASLRSRVGEP